MPNSKNSPIYGVGPMTVAEFIKALKKHTKPTDLVIFNLNKGPSGKATSWTIDEIYSGADVEKRNDVPGFCYLWSHNEKGKRE